MMGGTTSSRAARLLSCLALLVALVCVDVSAQCLDNQVPVTNVGYVQVCWISPVSGVVFTQLTSVDNELKTWTLDLTSFALYLGPNTNNLLANPPAPTFFNYGNLVGYTYSFMAYSVTFSMLAGNTELQIEIKTNNLWASAAVLWGQLIGSIQQGGINFGLNSLNDDYGVVRRHSPRLQDPLNLVALFDPLLNRKVSMRVRQFTNAQYLGWRTTSPPSSIIPSSAIVTEDGKTDGTMPVSPDFCQWDNGFGKNRVTNTNPVGVDIALGGIGTNADIIIMFGRPQEEGDQIRVYAPFTSMPPHTILSVNWGDGSSTVQNPQVDEADEVAYATHVYAAAGGYTITFSVQSLSVNPVIETTTIYLRILNAAPQVYLGNVEINNNALTVDAMQFFDKSTSETHTSDMLWGGNTRRIVPVTESTSAVGSVLGNIGVITPAAVVPATGGCLYVEIRVTDSACETGHDGRLISVGTHVTQYRELPCFLMYFRYIMSWDRRYLPPVGKTAIGQLQLWNYPPGTQVIKAGLVPVNNIDLSLGVAAPFTFARMLPGTYTFRLMDIGSSPNILVAESPPFELRAQKC